MSTVHYQSCNLQNKVILVYIWATRPLDVTLCRELDLELGIPPWSIEVLMPITPRIAAIGTRGGPITYLALSASICKKVNALAIDNAARFVYSSFESAHLSEQIRSHRGAPPMDQ